MSCWNRTTTHLRSGILYSYNTNLGDPKNLTTETHYSTNSYSTRNQNMIKGIAEYERIVSHIESYTGKLDFCPRVDDLAATYNALNEELGISGRVLNKAEFLKLADQRDSMLPKQPQGKSAIRGKKAASMKIHQLRGRGVDGGKIFVNVKSIRQRIENEKRIKEEERVQAQLKLEIEAINAESARLEKIRIDKQKQHDEKIRLEKIESERLQKIENDKKLAEQLLLIQNQSVTFNEQVNSGDFNETPITDVNLSGGCSECTTGTDLETGTTNDQLEKEPLKVTSGIAGIAALGIIGLLLYTRSVKK